MKINNKNNLNFKYMKTKHFLIIAILVISNCIMVANTKAQLANNSNLSGNAANNGVNNNIKKINEGVYLTVNDFLNNKISFVKSQTDKKYKLSINEIFNSSVIKIKIGNSVIKLNKDSVYGYRDKNNNCYRFYNKAEFKIINSSENFILYSKTSNVGGARSSQTVTNYYFSERNNPVIYQLSKSNLKKVFWKEVSFIELLNNYFESDKDLISYDNTTKTYRLDQVYNLSKQKIS